MAKAWAERSRVDVRRLEVGKEWEYNEEMEGRVREGLRAEVVKKMGWCVEYEGEKLVGTVEEIGKEEVGVVCVVGEGGGVDGIEGVERCDLREAMDQDGLRTLRELCGLGDILAVKRDRRTVPILLAMDLLRGYVGEEVETSRDRRDPA